MYSRASSEPCAVSCAASVAVCAAPAVLVVRACDVIDAVSESVTQQQRSPVAGARAPVAVDMSVKEESCVGPYRVDKTLGKGQTGTILVQTSNTYDVMSMLAPDTDDGLCICV